LEAFGAEQGGREGQPAKETHGASITEGPSVASKDRPAYGG